MFLRKFKTRCTLALAGIVVAFAACQSPFVSKAPAAPSSVITTYSTETSINIGWKDDTYSHSVYISTSSDGTYTLSGTTSYGSSYLASGLQSHSTYYFYVTASSGGVESERSAVVIGKTKLAAPKDFTFSKGAGKITLSWSAVKDATSYKVYKESYDYVLLGSPTTTSLDDGDAASAHKYYVVAACGDETSEKSSTISASANALDAPASFTATGTYDGIDLSWSAVTGAAGYDLYRSTSSYGFSKIYSGADLGYSDPYSSTSSSTQYYYVVARTASGSTGVYSPTKSASVTALDAPAGLSVSQSADASTLNVSWNTVDGAKSYDLYSGGSSSASSATLLSGGLSSTSYSAPASALSIGAKYYFVKAVRDSRSSASSVGVSYYAIRPIEIGSVAESGGGALVSWTGDYGAPSAVKVVVERAAAGSGSFAAINGAGSAYTSSSYADADASLGVGYDYRVRLTNGVATTSASSVKTITVSGKVTGLTASSGQLKQITLSWTSLGSKASSYKVYNAASPASPIATVSSSSYADTGIAGLEVSRTYYVVAVASSGDLPQSEVVTGTTFGKTPAEPTASVNGSTKVVTVSWTAIPGAKRYAVEIFKSGASGYVDTTYCIVDAQNSPYLTGTSASLSYSGLITKLGVGSYAFVVMAFCDDAPDANAADFTERHTAASGLSGSAFLY
jgi:fibronectin type 3 domain-containing protein